MQSDSSYPAVPLSEMGISSMNSIYYNLTEPALMNQAVLRGEGVLGLGGSLIVETGKHTGRSPKDKYIVNSKSVDKNIWWENNNKLSEKNFERLYDDIREHMKGKDYFVQDLCACADPDFKLDIRLINEYAWHSLFIRHLLRRPSFTDLKNYKPEFTIINCPSFKAVPAKYNVRSDTVIAINFEKKNCFNSRDCIRW